MPASAAIKRLVRRRIRHRLFDMRERHGTVERGQREHGADDDDQQDQQNKDRARQVGILQEIIRQFGISSQ